MLKKLLKYDLENIFKFLIIFYSLGLFFALLTRVFFSIENSLVCNIIAEICSGTAISMIFSVLINNLMRLWVRFKNHFYSDEAYLTHTLPISKTVLYLSKIITAVVSVFTSVGVIGVSLFIAYYSKENINLLKSIILPIAEAYESNIITILVSFFLVFFVEFAVILQAGFTGTILGHRMNSMKTGFSVLYGFATYICTQIFALLVIFIFSLFNEGVMNLFITNSMVDINIIKTVIYLAIAIYSIIFFALCFINIKLFKKGVNVD